MSGLGQPLSAEIDLISVQKGETLTARLGSIDLYQQANLPYNAALVGARVTVEKRPSGQPYIKVTTPLRVNEPFAELLIELNSENGRVTRQYTVLLDPPGYGRSAGEIPPPVVAAPTIRAPAPAQEARTPSTPQEAPAPAAAAPVAPADPGAPGPAAATGRVPSAKSAARPAAPSSTPATPTASARQYGPVKAGETLGRIARTVKPEGATLEQTLVGLYRQNPDAFIKKNMNLVKSGRILKVPEANEIATLPQREAVREVRLQSADFNSFRNRVADRAGNASEDGSVASGRIGTRIAGREAPEPRDTVRLSRGEASGKGGGKGNSADRMRALEEEAVAREKSLADANDRIAQLEKTIKDMQRLAEMKSAAPGAAQPPAGAVRQPPAGKATAPGPVAVAPVLPPAARAPEVAPSAPAPDVGKSAAADTGKGPDGEPRSEPAKTATRTRPPAATPAPAAEPDLIDTIMSEPLYLAAAGGAAVLLGGLALVAVRRRRGGREGLVKIAPTLGDRPDLRAVTPAPAVAPRDKRTAPAAAAPAPAPALAATGRRATAVEPERAPVVHQPAAAAAAPAKPATPAILAPASPAPAARTAAPIPPSSPPASEDNDLDFNAGSRPAPSRRPAPAPAPAPAAARPRPEVAPARDSATRLSALEASLGQARKAENPSAETALPNFSLDAPVADQPKPKLTPADTGLSEFNLEPLPAIGLPPDMKPGSTAAPASGKSALDFKLDDLNLDLADNTASAGAVKDDHWYDVQQKFDLAKAYQEMGDKDGARDILQEVVKEGDSQQQAQAQKVLGSLS